MSGRVISPGIVEQLGRQQPVDDRHAGCIGHGNASCLQSPEESGARCRINLASCGMMDEPGRPLGLTTKGFDQLCADRGVRSEEHTSELPSLMRISYAVFCL